MVLCGPRQPLRAVVDVRGLDLDDGGGSVHIRACAPRTTCMSWMANCQALSCRWIPGHEIVGLVAEAGGGGPINFKRATGLGYHGGWAGPAAPAGTAQRSTREPLRPGPASPATRSTGVPPLPTSVCFPIPDGYSDDEERLPLLCAGFIGYRSLAKTGQGSGVGIYGFGQGARGGARFQGREIYAFTRRGTRPGQRSQGRSGPLGGRFGLAAARPLMRPSFLSHGASRFRWRFRLSAKAALWCRSGIGIERHPRLSCCAALGRAHPVLRGQSDPGRWPGASRPGAPWFAGPHNRRDTSSGPANNALERLPVGSTCGAVTGAAQDRPGPGQWGGNRT